MISKTFALLLSFILTLSAFASNLPLKVKGQSGSAINTTDIVVPNSQATNLGRNTALLETGNNNLLANPSFEAPLVGGAAPSWTTPDATLAIETTDAFHGKQALKATYSAKPVNLYQSSALNASAFVNGANGVRSTAVKTSIAYTSTLKIYVCGVYAGVLKATSDGTSITDCKEVDNNGSWGEYVYASQLGATSNGIAVVSLDPTTGALVNVTGDVFIDKAEVSQTNRVGIAPIDTDWVNYTPSPTLSAHTGTVSGARYSRQESNILVNATVTISSVSSGNFVVGNFLPNNLKIDTRTLTTGSVIGTVWMYDLGVKSFTGSVLLSDSDDNSIRFVPSDGSAVLVGTSIPFAWGSGDLYSFEISVPIEGWSSSTSYLAEDCSGGKCVDTFSATVSSTGAVSGENVDWINGNCTNATIRACTFKTGIFTETPVCTATITETAATVALTESLPSVTPSALSIRTSYTNSVGVFTDHPYIVSISCQKAGTDFKASRTMVAEITDMAKSEGSGGVDIQMVTFAGATTVTVCSTSPCTIHRKKGTRITHVERVAAGQYHIYGISGISYFCSGAGAASNANIVLANDSSAPSSSFARMVAQNSAGATVDTAFNTVICIGTK